jgi:hypothetical protein
MKRDDGKTIARRAYGIVENSVKSSPCPRVWTIDKVYKGSETWYTV